VDSRFDGGPGNSKVPFLYGPFIFLPPAKTRSKEYQVRSSITRSVPKVCCQEELCRTACSRQGGLVPVDRYNRVWYSIARLERYRHSQIAWASGPIPESQLVVEYFRDNSGTIVPSTEFAFPNRTTPFRRHFLHHFSGGRGLGARSRAITVRDHGAITVRSRCHPSVT